MGWFFGFKLHLVINDKGEILAFKITKANTDDRKPVDELTQVGLTRKDELSEFYLLFFH